METKKKIKRVGVANLRVSVAEAKRWKRCSKLDGRTLSSWLRKLANDAADAILLKPARRKAETPENPV